jgi:calcineurin-like phosphoesterase family protein
MDISRLVEDNKVFFTADNHFKHDNIIKFTERPFANVDEMNQTLIQNWNRAVSDDCIVFHLGDFTLHDTQVADRIFRQLNGTVCILGIHWHHDKRWIGNGPYETSSGFPVEILPPEVVLTFGGGKFPKKIHLSHYPLAEWESKHYQAWHLHGHSHGNYKGDNHLTGDFCWDVGVDGIGMKYTPVSFGAILEWAYECNWGTV